MLCPVSPRCKSSRAVRLRPNGSGDPYMAQKDNRDGARERRTEESVPGRLESGASLCLAVPSRGSVYARPAGNHRLASPQCARLSFRRSSETRLQASILFTRWPACLPPQRLSCSRKMRNRCCCCSQSTRRATARRCRSRRGSGPWRVGGKNRSCSWMSGARCVSCKI